MLTNSSCIALGVGLRRVEHDAQARGEVRLGAAVRLRLLARDARAPPCATSAGIDAELAQHARHDAAGLLGERDEQMLGLDLRVIQLRRQLRRATTASCAFSVNLFRFMIFSF